MALAPSRMDAVVRCGTPEPSAQTRSFYNSLLQTHRQTGGSMRFAAGSKIPVAFHVVRTDAAGWDISDATLQSQLNVLNGAYAPIWFWDSALGWVWTTEANYGNGKYYWSPNLNTWIQYLSGSIPRVFKNLTTMQTFAVQPGQRTGI